MFSQKIAAMTSQLISTEACPRVRPTVNQTATINAGMKRMASLLRSLAATVPASRPAMLIAETVSAAHTKYHASTLTGSGSSAKGTITIEYGGG